MNSLIYKHKDFISQLTALKNNKSQLSKFIKKSKNSQIKALCELAHNILSGGLFCSPYRKRKLKVHKTDIRLLGDKHINIQRKKARLLKGRGLLLTALLPLAVQFISKLVGSSSSSK